MNAVSQSTGLRMELFKDETVSKWVKIAEDIANRPIPYQKEIYGGLPWCSCRGRQVQPGVLCKHEKRNPKLLLLSMTRCLVRTMYYNLIRPGGSDAQTPQPSVEIQPKEGNESKFI